MLEFCAIMPNRFGGNEMLEVYVLVEKKKSLIMKALTVLCFVVGAYFMYATIRVSILFFSISVPLIAVGVFLKNRKLEYEYSLGHNITSWIYVTYNGKTGWVHDPYDEWSNNEINITNIYTSNFEGCNIKYIYII